MVIIVGDSPSKNNKDPNVAFVGTKSYKNLLKWIYKLDIDVTNTVLCNKDELKTYGYIDNCYVERNDYFMDIDESLDKIIVLGNKAEKKVKELGILTYYKLPHPSPKNRKLNDKKELTKLLKDCKLWLNN